MMGDAIEQRGGHLGIAEHGGPFAERQVGGDDHRCAFVKLADQVEQQLPARPGKRQIAKFIEDDEIEAGELRRQRAGLADTDLLLEAGYQVEGVEVAAAGTGADDAGGDGDGQMGLAGAGRTGLIMPDIINSARGCGSATRFILASARS